MVANFLKKVSCMACLHDLSIRHPFMGRMDKGPYLQADAVVHGEDTVHKNARYLPVIIHD